MLGKLGDGWGLEGIEGGRGRVGARSLISILWGVSPIKQMSGGGGEGGSLYIPHSSHNVHSYIYTICTHTQGARWALHTSTCTQATCTPIDEAIRRFRQLGNIRQINACSTFLLIFSLLNRFTLTGVNRHIYTSPCFQYHYSEIKAHFSGVSTRTFDTSIFTKGERSRDVQSREKQLWKNRICMQLSRVTRVIKTDPIGWS
jgi:hypothetical protein